MNLFATLVRPRKVNVRYFGACCFGREQVVAEDPFVRPHLCRTMPKMSEGHYCVEAWRTGTDSTVSKTSFTGVPIMKQA